MIYFDNAATSFPKDPGMIRVLERASSLCGNPGRSGYRASLYASEKLYECREKASELFGTVPEKVVLTPSCTLAVNAAVHGLVKGGKVVMSNLEHNAVCRPLYALRRDKRITLEVFDALNDPVGSFIKASDGASALVMTHASNVCGAVIPAAEIAKEAKKRGMTVIIDAAQSACHMPVSFDDIDADVICVSGHKGPGGPLGTGLMLLSPKSSGIFDPLVRGGTGIYSLDEDMPDVLPERYEAGTVNAPAFASLAYSLGRSNKKSADPEVFRRLLDSLRDMKGVTVYLPPEGTQCLPILLFNVDGIPCDDVMTRLAEKDICVRSGYHCSFPAHNALGSVHGGVRASLGANNTAREVMTFVDEIRKTVKYK